MRRGLLTRLRPRRSREGGFTLPEVMISMMILGIALAVFYGVLASVQRVSVRNDFLSRANDQARLALTELDREIRSGNVLYDPGDVDPTKYGLPDDDPLFEYPNNFTFKIYTQTNATTRQPNPGYLCALWTINDQNQLVKNLWPPQQPDQATGWRVVAEGVANRVLNVAMFTLNSDVNKGSRTVDITLVVNPEPERTSSRTVRIQMSSTGRNTSYGFPVNVCDAAPPLPA